MTNISLLLDINKIDKRATEIVNTMNRAHLIATLYVLKEDPTNSFTKNKEENNMKIGSKISNRTKVLGGTTILLGIATGICIVRDRLGLKTEDETTLAEIAEGVTDAIGETAEEIGEVVDF